MSEKSTRDRILEEASALFVEQGLSFSLRALGERVGVSAPAIYRHFESKEGLLGAVCHQGFTLFAAYLWRALAEDDALGRLDATRLQYCHFALEQPTYYRTMFMTSGVTLGWKQMPLDNQDRAHGTFQFLVDRVRECQDAGHLAEGPPDALALKLWAFGHGLVSLRLAGHLDRLEPEAFIALYVESCAEQRRALAA